MARTFRGEVMELTETEKKIIEYRRAEEKARQKREEKNRRWHAERRADIVDGIRVVCVECDVDMIPGEYWAPCGDPAYVRYKCPNCNRSRAVEN